MKLPEIIATILERMMACVLYEAVASDSGKVGTSTDDKRGY